MRSITTHAAGETRALARALAKQLRPGDVLLLTGQMGAGKSEFARGLARGLGIQGHVPSPTFTLLNLYQEGSMPYKHFDWYRIEDPEELYAAGLDEQVGGEGLTVIEWHERAPELVPEDCLEVRVTPISEHAREIAFVPRGAFRALGWDALLKEYHEHTGD